MYPKKSISAGFLIVTPCCQQEPALLIALLTTVALWLDYVCVPAVTNVKPALTSALLTALLLRRLYTGRTAARTGTVIKRWRVVLFVFCHVAVIVAGSGLARRGIITSRHMVGLVQLAVAKYFIIVPTILLLSGNEWRRFARLYRAELIAALMALATFPSRIWAITWPWYSWVLAHGIYALATPFVSRLQYITGSFPTLSGPALDTTITFACGGMLIVELFQLLFGIVLVVDWNKLDHCRTLVAYCAGTSLVLFANVVRIALLVVVGNSISADFVVARHLALSWFVIAIALVAFVQVAFPRMLNDEHRSSNRLQSI